tara:strand:+ start:639 stop:812 length:174 start_codon:yes stop_codon:yes gene_type:complete
MINSTYHIYLRGECLFKDLDEYEFDVIWGRIYETYFKDDLTYEQIDFDDSILKDASY